MRKPVIAVPEEGQTQSSSATRYGILMSGPKFIEWNLVGEMAIGHVQVDRRDLTAFVNINVGRRNESEMAISDANERLHEAWYKNPDRIVTKTAAECANDVKSTYGDSFGFVIPSILIGLAEEVAEALVDRVLPAEVREKTLVDVIDHLKSTGFTELQPERLRVELLDAAYLASNFLTKYVIALEGEMGIARDKGTGKRGPDPVEVEFFRELKRPLPAEVPAIATMAMGKEIADKLNGGGTTEVLKAILEQNQLLMKQLQQNQAPQPIPVEDGKKKKTAEQG